ncbi:MAG: type II secretion system F family protein [Elusimicrobiaceae bacterium]
MDITRLLILSAGVVSTIGVFVLLQRLFTPVQKDENSISSLVKYKSKETSAFASVNPNGSIIDKIDYFFVFTLNKKASLEKTHMLLGSPENKTPLGILHEKIIFALVFPGIGIALTRSPFFILLVPLFFFIPDALNNAKIRARQNEILGNFATFVDLSALIIESGLDYITAFDRIVRLADKKTQLEFEIEKTLNEVQLGYSRREALERFASRTDIQELRSFVGLIIQSDELGTSLVELLRNFSSDMRFRRLTRAEKLAAQASTKMLIPLFIFIFPTVFILMLGPMVMDLLSGSLSM